MVRADDDESVTGHRHDPGGAGVVVPDDDRRSRETFAQVLAPLLRRLQTADVINRGMMFAAVLLLCLVPFCIVLQSLAGRSAATRLTERYGLDAEAADAVGQVFASPSAASAAMTAASWLILIVFAVGTAATLQELYQASFGVERTIGGNVVRCVIWLAALISVSVVGAVAQPWLSDVGGGVLVVVVSFAVATAFWWFTMWLLLAGRMSWAELFPSALATGLFWAGMQIVFRLTMSDMIVSNYAKYGAIGVVFTLMTLMVAIGVVIILGAITGAVWRERSSSEPVT
jgi:membrane protein